jgi:hypothetical protein
VIDLLAASDVILATLLVLLGAALHALMQTFRGPRFYERLGIPKAEWPAYCRALGLDTEAKQRVFVTQMEYAMYQQRRKRRRAIWRALWRPLRRR